MKKKKSVASVSHNDGPFIIGVSDVIRWGDVMTIQGTDIQVSKAVDLGIKYTLPIAKTLKKDLKSKVGLLITFPMAMLMSQLQQTMEDRGVGSGPELLALVKPE